MKNRNIFLLLLIVTFIFSCGKELSVEELIQIEVDRKINTLKMHKLEACRQYIIEEAEIYVDSIMYMKVGNKINDNIFLPERPERPEDSLGYEVELDSIKPEDVFNDSLGFEKTGIEAEKLD